MPTITQPIANIFKAAHIPANELSIAASTSGFIITHSTTGKQYFTKTDRNVPQMLGEVASLLAMSKTSRGLVPEVLGFEVSPDGKEATMVTQWFDLSSARGGHTQRGLGSKLAQMHMPPPEGTEGYEGKYGFPVPTHCGATEQDNTWEESWEVFWRDRRLGNLVNRIGDKEINALWEDMKRKCVDKSHAPPRRPALRPLRLAFCKLWLTFNNTKSELSLSSFIHSPRPLSLLSSMAIFGRVMPATTKRHLHPSSLIRPRTTGIMRQIWGLPVCLVVCLFLSLFCLYIICKTRARRADSSFSFFPCPRFLFNRTEPITQIGFSYEFYDEYHLVHPRSSPYYDERQKLYELYHHLNVRFYVLHTVHAANPSNHLLFNLSDHSFSNE